MTLVLFAVAACGGGAGETPPLEATPTAVSQTQAAADAPALQIALASTDLSVGPNRVVFGLIDSQSGPLRDVAAQLYTFHLMGGSPEGPKETAEAVFRKWPVGLGGVYTTQVSFDRPGTWGLAVSVAEADLSIRTTSASVQVKENSATPAIGSLAPRSIHKTAVDAARIEEITTDLDPDPGLYSSTIAQAIDGGKPLVVVFATPAYCQTSTCGPQLDVVKGLKQQYGDRMSFIHIEIYDNPLEIQGDLSRGRIAPTVTEWNLPSEPWTFVIDGAGIVRAKFEAFTTSQELEEALGAVLE